VKEKKRGIFLLLIPENYNHLR